MLGQYEIFGTGGRLLLVAPNIVATERKLGVDPADFRLWVCLHEVTHQLQFTAVPWLKAHLEARDRRSSSPATDLTADVLRERLQDVLRSLVDAVRGGDGESEGLMALVRDPAQRAVLDRVTAVMSLVEGHAEYVMDGVGPDVVPSVRTLRKRFAQRRKGRGPARPGPAPAARPRAEDEAVRRRADLRRRCHRPGRHGGLQPRLGGPGEPAADRGAHRPARWVERVHGRPAIPA